MRLILAALTLIAFSGSIVQAETTSALLARLPKKVGDFVPYCTGHFKDCRDIVIIADIELMAERMAPTCGGNIPTRNNDVATKSIVDWLARHKETHGMPTRTGIKAAMKALPCSIWVKNSA